MDLSAGLSYLDSLVGIPYVWWMEGDICLGDAGPFWAASGPPPSRQRLEQEGICCAGVLNLLCRQLNAEIPGVREGLWNAGGTYVWEAYWRSKDMLRPWNSTEPLLPGTILFLPYESELQQGHVAVAVDSDTILHSWCEKDEPQRGLYGPGVMKQSLKEALSIFPFTHAVYPPKYR